MATKNNPRIPLPKAWRGHVRSAVLHVISLAQYATVYTVLVQRFFRHYSRIANHLISTCYDSLRTLWR